MNGDRPINPKTRDTARGLRHVMTVPERLLWGKLRAGRLGGLKFRRQHPLEPFVVDYACVEKKLIVELDGETHVGRAMQDFKRTKFFESLGYRVIRFTNDEVIQSLDAVLEQIGREAGLKM